MRPTIRLTHPSAILAVLLLALPIPARAGVVTVDTTYRTVDTSKLFLQFDLTRPEQISNIYFKDFSPNQPLTAYYVSDGEYFGQTMRNTSSPGFVGVGPYVSSSWTLTSSSATQAELTISTQTTGQPPVTTRYVFFADQPYFAVFRTIRFSALADTAAYQPYLPRFSFIYPYRAARWRDMTGTVVQRTYCVVPCLRDGWDGRWVELMSYDSQSSGYAITTYYAGLAPGTQLVQGYGPNLAIGWVAPLVPAGTHAQDATLAQLVGFSTAPDDYAAQDAMWTAFTSGVLTADVPAADGADGLRLAVAPNPSRGAATIEWTNPRPGAFALDVLDVSGRRVATLEAGWKAAGRHAASWAGRRDDGSTAPPGLYFARLRGAGAMRVARLVRVN